MYLKIKRDDLSKNTVKIAFSSIPILKRSNELRNLRQLLWISITLNLTTSTQQSLLLKKLTVFHVNTLYSRNSAFPWSICQMFNIVWWPAGNWEQWWLSSHSFIMCSLRIWNAFFPGFLYRLPQDRNEVEAVRRTLLAKQSNILIWYSYANLLHKSSLLFHVPIKRMSIRLFPVPQ